MDLQLSPLQAAIRKLGAAAVLEGLGPELRELLQFDWEANARPLRRLATGEWAGQLPPPGDWSTWLFMAGRRTGKNWTGAHYIQALAEKNPDAHIALVGRTAGDTRKVMVFGKTGIMRIAPPWFRPRWFQTDQMLIWPNGACASLYSAEESARLRGPEHTDYWADEICAWSDPETYDMLLMTMSGGDNPRGLVTTTPAISTILDDILRDAENTVVSRATTYDNAANLPPKYLKKLLKKFEGTQLGRQELFGERLLEIQGARWTRDLINAWRVRDVRTALVRIVVAVDPANMTYEAAQQERDQVEDVDRDQETAGNRALCGIVVVGLGEDGHCYVLEDLSKSETPAGWARRAIGAFKTWRADRIVYEINHGGKAVEKVFRNVDPEIPLKSVVARKGKVARAEPVVSLYEIGKVHHVGGATRPALNRPLEEQKTLVYLEDQMCSWTPKQRRSPDRMDALVYAITELKKLDRDLGGGFSLA